MISIKSRSPLQHIWKTPMPWWRHKMETFSALLALCAGNSPVTGEFPLQRPVTRSFDVFFDLSLNKRVRRSRWFETPSSWRQCNTTKLPFQRGCVSLTDTLTSCYGNTFRIICPLCGEFTGHRWSPIARGQWCRALMLPALSAWTICQTFQAWFLKRGPTYRRQVVNPRQQTQQGQSVAKPGPPL